MARALHLAGRGLYTTHPNPRVGCVLVKNDRIVAEGWHEFAGGAHAEVNALNNARDDASGAACYLTLEPCSHTGRTPPCADALIQAGIKKVTAAMLDPNPEVSGKGILRLEQAGVETAVGLMSEQAQYINRGYVMRRTLGRPFIRCKLAMSLDGRTAMADGESIWISGPEARADVQRFRAQSSAIMTGIGTVLADDPGLDVRDIGLERHPVRVVIDPELKFPESARMLGLPGGTIIFTAGPERESQMKLEQAGAEIVLIDDNKETFLNKVLAYLAVTEEINEVLLESGPTLAGSMLSEGLIDEIILYQAPVLMGDGARGLFHLPEIRSMEDKIVLELVESRRVGIDFRFTFNTKPGSLRA